MAVKCETPEAPEAGLLPRSRASWPPMADSLREFEDSRSSGRLRRCPSRQANHQAEVLHCGLGKFYVQSCTQRQDLAQLDASGRSGDRLEGHLRPAIKGGAEGDVGLGRPLARGEAHADVARHHLLAAGPPPSEWLR